MLLFLLPHTGDHQLCVWLNNIWAEAAQLRDGQAARGAVTAAKITFSE